jgi:hypothetical protein
MAALSNTQILEAGIIVATTSLEASNTFSNTGSQFIYFKNTSGVTKNINVTVTTTTVTSELYGNLIKTNPTTKAVANGETCLIGPFAVEAYNNTSGNVTFGITPYNAEAQDAAAILYL